MLLNSSWISSDESYSWADTKSPESLTIYVALEAAPTIKSPEIKLVPNPLTLRILVSASQFLTNPDALEIEPVTVSLKIKFPDETVLPAEIVIVGISVYPYPAFIILIVEIPPTLFKNALAVAVVPQETGDEIVTVGSVTYPLPKLFILIGPILPEDATPTVALAL